MLGNRNPVRRHSNTATQLKEDDAVVSSTQPGCLAGGGPPPPPPPRHDGWIIGGGEFDRCIESPFRLYTYATYDLGMRSAPLANRANSRTWARSRPGCGPFTNQIPSHYRQNRGRERELLIWRWLSVSTPIFTPCNVARQLL